MGRVKRGSRIECDMQHYGPCDGCVTAFYPPVATKAPMFLCDKHRIQITNEEGAI